MWIYNVCRACESRGNLYELLESYTDRTIAYLRLFSLMKNKDPDCHYFVERVSDKKLRK
ncbi:hypothetical protein SAMN05720759_10320 [Fibrobacter sp. UWB12]|nr:hypothetical protein SAMN05720759_10320 [Fibrobacter sp. UWB12]